MAAVWTDVSEPEGGAAWGVGSVLCASGMGTTWSTATSQPTQTHRVIRSNTVKTSMMDEQLEKG